MQRCACKEGYYRPDATGEGDCVTEAICKTTDIDLTCGPNEESTDSYDRCEPMCENFRLGTNRTDCSTGPAFPGCHCIDGYTRLTSDPFSPCVPSNECIDKYNEDSCESFDIIEVIDGTQLPLRFDIRNRRTWIRLLEKFQGLGFDDFVDSMSVVDVKDMAPGFVLDGTDVPEEFAIGFQIVMCPSIDKNLLDDFIATVNDADLIPEWSREFALLVSELGLYFPCYDSTCDEGRLECDVLSQTIGCPADDQLTCQD